MKMLVENMLTSKTDHDTGSRVTNKMFAILEVAHHISTVFTTFKRLATIIC